MDRPPRVDRPPRARVGGSRVDRRPHKRDWAWRRRIRSDPRAYGIYRIVVGVLGGLLLLLSAATGWLPGPGGIPLALLGLAVLASEYHWARRTLDRARDWGRDAAERARRRPAWQRRAGGGLTALGVLFGVWLSLRVLGIPGWLPDDATAMLTGVPGLG